MTSASKKQSSITSLDCRTQRATESDAKPLSAYFAALEIAKFEPTLLDEWRDRGLWPKIEVYTLRYVVPTYELLRASGNRYVVPTLVVQRQCCKREMESAV